MLVSGFMLLSALVALLHGCDDSIIPLLYSGVVTGVLGIFPSFFVRRTGKLSQREGYLIVVGSWLLSCFTGMIPYLLYGGEFGFVNAMFESVSGFTTTGASILNDIEALPRGLLFWRMSTAWIGGIGIVVLFSLLVPSSSGNDTTLAGVEVSEIARDSSRLKPSSFVHMMIGVYLALSIGAFLSLKLCGLGWFDAATQAMSAISTCGFSTRNASIAAFDSVAVELVLSVFMIMASLRFSLIFSFVFDKGHSKLFSSEVTRTFLLMIAVGIALLTAGLGISGYYDSFGTCLRVSTFQVASIFTTTGFATVDTNLWPPFCAAVIVAGSIVCGCSGSTSGGMKVDRLLLAAKAFANKVKNLQNPNILSPVKVDGQIKREKAINTVMIFIASYLVIILVGALVNSMAGLDLKTAWTASVACMGNVGPGLGDVGSMANYAALPGLVKWNSMALMLIGRLEIFPLFYVFGQFGRSNRSFSK